MNEWDEEFIFFYSRETETMQLPVTTCVFHRLRDSISVSDIHSKFVLYPFLPLSKDVAGGSPLDFLN